MKKFKVLTILKIFLLSILLLLILRLVSTDFMPTMAENKPKIAIVIDDFGNNQEGSLEMLKLPIKFTGAVMPDMPKSEKEMNLLLENGKEVILHQPMQAHTGKVSWLGSSPILSNMSIKEVENVFKKNKEQINKAVGFNNHMGSLITEDREKMESILKIAKESNWFYIDSVTSSKSVAYDVAKSLGVKAVKRDVFLDSTKSKEKVKQNLRKTIEIAQKKGSALAIGHVGAEGGKITAEAILEIYNEYKNDVEFVYASQLAN